MSTGKEMNRGTQTGALDGEPGLKQRSLNLRASRSSFHEYILAGREMYTGEK